MTLLHGASMVWTWHVSASVFNRDGWSNMAIRTSIIGHHFDWPGIKQCGPRRLTSMRTPICHRSLLAGACCRSTLAACHCCCQLAARRRPLLSQVRRVLLAACSPLPTAAARPAATCRCRSLLLKIPRVTSGGPVPRFGMMSVCDS